MGASRRALLLLGLPLLGSASPAIAQEGGGHFVVPPPWSEIGGAEEAGDCKWPEEEWSPARHACVESSNCGAGLELRNGVCVPAGACPPGEAMGPNTAGRCCFPGQSWSDEHGCVGVPTCDEGFARDGEVCVPRLEPPAPAKLLPDGTVPITFVAKADDRYRIAIAGKSCVTPCLMFLPPGPARLEVGGDGAFTRDVVIPSRASLMRVQHSANRIIAAGAVLLALGGAVLVANSLVPNLVDPHSGPTIGAVTTAGWVAGPILFVAGDAALIAGVSHAFGSNRFVRWRGPEISERARAEPPLRLVGLGVAPSPSGAAAGATFTF